MTRIAILVGLTLALVATRAGAVCAGDCGGDGLVTINELISGVNIALGTAGQCASFDTNNDGMVVINELVAAVANALNGCPFTGRYAARVDVGDGETGLVRLQVASDGTATGTLEVGPTGSTSGAALHLEIPLLNLTGTVDLDSGAFHLSGTVTGRDGDIPVDVSGTLPERPGLNGTLDLDIGDQSFGGPIVAGNGDPTPTPTNTRPATSPTPTFTPMPASFPTPPGHTCLNGTFSLVFRDFNGANPFADLSHGLAIQKGTFNNIPGLVFGGGAVPCTLMASDVLRRVQLTYIGASAVEGATLTLGRARGDATFDYLEAPATNPLATRGWRADSGSLVIDHLDASGVRFHIVNAVLSPELSFSSQTPAMGSITIDAGAEGTFQQ